MSSHNIKVKMDNGKEFEVTLDPYLDRYIEPIDLYQFYLRIVSIFMGKQTKGKKNAN